MRLFKCKVCGYVHRGEDAPESCPKCGVGREKFVELEEQAANLIEKSRETNDLHLEVFSLLEKVVKASERGAEINLDPGCFKIFNSLAKSSKEYQQMILAEINGHVGKGKFN